MRLVQRRRALGHSLLAVMEVILACAKYGAFCVGNCWPRGAGLVGVPTFPTTDHEARRLHARPCDDYHRRHNASCHQPVGAAEDKEHDGGGLATTMGFRGTVGWLAGRGAPDESAAPVGRRRACPARRGGAPLPGGASLAVRHELPGDLLPVKRWGVTFKGRWRYDEHQHLRECRTALMVVRHLARSEVNWQKHVLVFTDRLVTLGTLVIGRSSSAGLLLVLRGRARRPRWRWGYGRITDGVHKRGAPTSCNYF